jgi:diphthine synthase
MTLCFISIGLHDEKDMSIKALEAAKGCDILFVEFYTTKLDTTKEKLEKLIGKQIKILSRKDVEEKYKEIILKPAKTKRVGLLVGGDVFAATTHLALRLEAMKQGIETKVIHGSSIFSAIGETGLHLYKFGATATVPLPEKTPGKLPESVYDVIRLNKAHGLHTLLLLDIDTEQNKFMTPKEAMKILLEIENKRKQDVFTEYTDVVVFSKAGSNDPSIVYGKVVDLMKRDFDLPAVIIVPGILHFTEKECLKNFKLFKV